MRVIGAGFGRTGTLSMKVALEQLGFGPCHHMSEVVERHGQLRRWLALASGHPVDWDELLGGYESCVDWPSAAYWRELAEHFPQARVVLTVRDPERWLASMNATILKQRRRPLIQGLSSLLGTDLAAFIRMTRLTVVERVFDGRTDDRDYLLKAFTRHVEEVKATIPAERLLVFEVSQGWEPLCDFLGVPVPSEPFPRVNDAAHFDRFARSHIAPLMFRRTP
ncbi:sulfotransferase family protein [Nonomuraea sp. NPDC050536]|uniref:sulfotransferase family protein n=1 Tax=Nonomuraea sp. NPDC050536 TaxID=3364366 RepID=UPI0037CC7195